jgi:flagellar basal body-associated protein FliL
MENGVLITFQTVAAFIGAASLPLFIWWLSRRKSEEDRAEETRQRKEEEFKADLAMRLNNHGERLRQLELEMRDKAGKEELARAIERVRDEMRTDLSQFFEQLRALLITMKRNEP